MMNQGNSNGSASPNGHLAVAALIGIVVGTAIYAPISMWAFETSLWTVLDRFYFMICGAAIVLYGMRSNGK